MKKKMSLYETEKRNSNKVAFIFLFPVFLILIVFIFYPILQTFRISAYQWNGISLNKEYIGLQNWIVLLFDNKFWTAFSNNLKIMVLSIAIQIPLGLALATFLDFGGKKFNIYKVLWFIPMLMSSVAIGFLFSYALSVNGGIISTFSNFIGKGNVDLLGNSNRALYAVIGVICWQFTPFYMVYCMAAYSSIPYELFEAAKIDGASKSKYFWNISLPILKPSLFSASILSIVGSLKYFDLIYVMTGGGPGTSTELMATYMYKMSFKTFKMGYGSTVAGAMFILISLISLLTFRILSGKGDL